MEKRLIEPFVEKVFENDVLPSLQEFLRYKNISPDYDPQWKEHEEMVKVANFLKTWVESQELDGCAVTVVQDGDHTPMLHIEIEASDIKMQEKTILYYGHMDKQPPLTGWTKGEPFNPKIIDNKLYGRGSSDDGYAIFAAISSIKTCQKFKWPMPRIIILIEAAEESGTADLFYYVDQLKEIIKQPDLIICLDSGCMDYNRLWVSTSLRGVIGVELKVSVLKNGVHSGFGGGIVPDSFLIMRRLLDRIDDSNTGKLKPETLLDMEPSEERLKQIEKAKDIIGDNFYKLLPFYNNTQPLETDVKNLIIRNTWKPTLTIIGAEGFPDTAIGSNLIRTSSTLKLSIRLPPLLNDQIKTADKAGEKIKQILEANPPFGAKVEAKFLGGGDGWNLKTQTTKLQNLLNISSKMFFDKEMAYFGEGGSVPFVNYFNSIFPNADLCVLGVCGPDSNIHGPDESLDLQFARKLIMCLTYVISAYSI